MDALVSQISRTLAQANAFLVARIKSSGLDGIAPSHGDILNQLFANERMCMHSLAASIGRDPSTVTTLVGKLADAGYVHTERSARDKRMIIVSLTDAGRALGGEFSRISAELEAVQNRGVEPQEHETAMRVLQTVQRNFEREMEGEAK